MSRRKRPRRRTGFLSKPGKMPGPSYSLPADNCRTGHRLRRSQHSVCAFCYAMRGRYRFPAVRRAMQRHLRTIRDPRWVDRMVQAIRNSGAEHFRWHDSGDLQNMRHLRKIIAVCNALPEVKFWLPTKEHRLVERYRRVGGEIPPNLCIRYSSHFVDRAPPSKFGMPMSSVSSSPENTPAGAYRCSAEENGNVCGRCRACWDRRITLIDFPLKWYPQRNR
ncbi:MAG: hypothetical protein ROO76_07310 [Terriglobia bacterium]|nr:hypothetical protein [Terriglobia bacterium]